ncbi:hypothetical protein ABK040_014660 [Willaertia magna]
MPSYFQHPYIVIWELTEENYTQDPNPTFYDSSSSATNNTSSSSTTTSFPANNNNTTTINSSTTTSIPQTSATFSSGVMNNNNNQQQSNIAYTNNKYSIWGKFIKKLFINNLQFQQSANFTIGNFRTKMNKLKQKNDNLQNNNTLQNSMIQNQYLPIITNYKIEFYLSNDPKLNGFNNLQQNLQKDLQKETYSRHFTTLNKNPYLNLFIVQVEDLELYKNIFKPKIKKWVDYMSEREYEYLIIYISKSESSNDLLKKLSFFSKVYDKLKNDFSKNVTNNNLNNNNLITGNNNNYLNILNSITTIGEKGRVLKLNTLSLLTLNNLINNISTPLQQQNTLQNNNQNNQNSIPSGALDNIKDLYQRIHEGIILEFLKKIYKFEEEIKKSEMNMNLPGWQFTNYFILKEGLSITLEQFGLFINSLGIYNQLLTFANEETSTNSNSSINGNSVINSGGNNNIVNTTNALRSGGSTSGSTGMSSTPIGNITSLSNSSLLGSGGGSGNNNKLTTSSTNILGSGGNNKKGNDNHLKRMPFIGFINNEQLRIINILEDNFNYFYDEQLKNSKIYEFDFYFYIFSRQIYLYLKLLTPDQVARLTLYFIPNMVNRMINNLLIDKEEEESLSDVLNAISLEMNNIIDSPLTPSYEKNQQFNQSLQSTVNNNSKSTIENNKKNNIKWTENKLKYFLYIHTWAYATSLCIVEICSRKLVEGLHDETQRNLFRLTGDLFLFTRYQLQILSYVFNLDVLWEGLNIHKVNHDHSINGNSNKNDNLSKSLLFADLSKNYNNLTFDEKANILTTFIITFDSISKLKQQITIQLEFDKLFLDLSISAATSYTHGLRNRMYQKLNGEIASIRFKQNKFKESYNLLKGQFSTYLTDGWLNLASDILIKIAECCKHLKDFEEYCYCCIDLLCSKFISKELKYFYLNELKLSLNNLNNNKEVITNKEINGLFEKQIEENSMYYTCVTTVTKQNEIYLEIGKELSLQLTIFNFNFPTFENLQQSNLNFKFLKLYFLKVDNDDEEDEEEDNNNLVILNKKKYLIITKEINNFKEGENIFELNEIMLKLGTFRLEKVTLTITTTDMTTDNNNNENTLQLIIPKKKVTEERIYNKPIVRTANERRKKKLSDNNSTTTTSITTAGNNNGMTEYELDAATNVDLDNNSTNTTTMNNTITSTLLNNNTTNLGSNLSGGNNNNSLIIDDDISTITTTTVTTLKKDSSPLKDAFLILVLESRPTLVIGTQKEQLFLLGTLHYFCLTIDTKQDHILNGTIIVNSLSKNLLIGRSNSLNSLQNNNNSLQQQNNNHALMSINDGPFTMIEMINDNTIALPQTNDNDQKIIIGIPIIAIPVNEDQPIIDKNNLLNNNLDYTKNIMNLNKECNLFSLKANYTKKLTRENFKLQKTFEITFFKPFIYNYNFTKITKDKFMLQIIIKCITPKPLIITNYELQYLNNNLLNVTKDFNLKNNQHEMFLEDYISFIFEVTLQNSLQNVEEVILGDMIIDFTIPTQDNEMYKFTIPKIKLPKEEDLQIEMSITCHSENYSLQDDTLQNEITTEDDTLQNSLQNNSLQNEKAEQHEVGKSLQMQIEIPNLENLRKLINLEKRIYLDILADGNKWAIFGTNRILLNDHLQNSLQNNSLQFIIHLIPLISGYVSLPQINLLELKSTTSIVNNIVNNNSNNQSSLQQPSLQPLTITNTNNNNNSINPINNNSGSNNIEYLSLNNLLKINYLNSENVGRIFISPLSTNDIIFGPLFPVNFPNLDKSILLQPTTIPIYNSTNDNSINSNLLTPTSARNLRNLRKANSDDFNNNSNSNNSSTSSFMENLLLVKTPSDFKKEIKDEYLPKRKISSSVSSGNINELSQMSNNNSNVTSVKNNVTSGGVTSLSQNNLFKPLQLNRITTPPTGFFRSPRLINSSRMKSSGNLISFSSSNNNENDDDCNTEGGNMIFTTTNNDYNNNIHTDLSLIGGGSVTKKNRIIRRLPHKRTKSDWIVGSSINNNSINGNSELLSHNNNNNNSTEMMMDNNNCDLQSECIIVNNNLEENHFVKSNNNNNNNGGYGKKVELNSFMSGDDDLSIDNNQLTGGDVEEEEEDEEEDQKEISNVSV